MGCGASASVPQGAGEATSAAKAEEKTLRSIFNSIDVDGDGAVTKNELQKKLQADSAVQDLLTKAGGAVDYVMEQLDVDGDGIVTWSEFEAMLSTDASKLAVTVGVAVPVELAEATSLEKLKKLYDAIDTSGDGQVSREELRAHMAKDERVVTLLVQAGGSREYVFEQLNENEDGFVSWDEFRSMLSADVGGFVGAKPATLTAPEAHTAPAVPAMSEEEEAAALLAEADEAMKE